MSEVKALLPWPPSVNRYWRSVNDRVLISRDGRAYRKAVEAWRLEWLPHLEPLSGPLSMTITVHPPDKRRRDLDNMLKALLDAMQHAGFYSDDYQIADLRIVRGEQTPGGAIAVRIES